GRHTSFSRDWSSDVCSSDLVFVTLEDETGMCNVIVQADLVERQRKELLGAQLLGVRGVVQHASDGDVVHVLAQYLVDHSELLGRDRKSTRLNSSHVKSPYAV